MSTNYYNNNIQQAQHQVRTHSNNGPTCSNVRSSPIGTTAVIERRAAFASFPPTNAALQQVNHHYRRPLNCSGPLLHHHQMHQTDNQFRTIHPGLGHSSSVKPTTTTQTQIEHKKLDRSLSEPVESQQQRAQQQVAQNSSRYKTELCRPFEENGTCKYGDKCQFAHGMQELRNLQRHPKYKTELCRTYHTTGLCPYGPRCHFIHNSEETKKSVISTLQSANFQAHQGVLRMRSVGSDAGFGHVIGNKLTRSVSTTAHGNRPKTMSVGSGFSLGSSGEVTPPSSPSGSPTSLGSFFNEDPFSTFSNHHHHHTSNLGTSAFSFNADFGVLLPTTTSSSHHRQKENQSMMTSSSNNNTTAIDSRRQTSKGGGLISSSSESDSSKSSSSSGIGCGSPHPTHSSSHYPGAPSSPVSSLGSDLETMSLGGGSSPDPCGSPMDSSSNSNQAILPRLPTFARFSNNDGLTDLRL